MAAVMNVVKRTLSVSISRGQDADGNLVSKSYTYSNVKPDADPDKLLATGKALGGAGSCPGRVPVDEGSHAARSKARRTESWEAGQPRRNHKGKRRNHTMKSDTDLDLVFKNAIGKKVTLNIEEPKKG